MKQIIFKRNDGYYMTNEKNYNAYVWNARQIKKLNDVKTLDDVYKVIDMFCTLYGDDESNYSIVI